MTRDERVSLVDQVAREWLGWPLGRGFSRRLLHRWGGGGGSFENVPVGELVPDNNRPQRCVRQENYTILGGWASNPPTSVDEDLQFEDDCFSIFAVLEAVAEGGLVSDLPAHGKEVEDPSVVAKFAEESRQDRLLMPEQDAESASRQPR